MCPPRVGFSTNGRIDDSLFRNAAGSHRGSSDDADNAHTLVAVPAATDPRSNRRGATIGPAVPRSNRREAAIDEPLIRYMQRRIRIGVMLGVVLGRTEEGQRDRD
jgi:hypothetical protein